MPGSRPDHSTRTRVRVVVASRAAISFDAREILLQREAIEELVVVDDAAKEPEKLGA